MAEDTWRAGEREQKMELLLIELRPDNILLIISLEAIASKVSDP